MSRYYKKSAGVILFITALCFFSFSGNYRSSEPEAINNYFNEFNEAVIKLDEAAGSYKFGKITLDSLQNTIKDTRIRYKKIEFYLAFYYAEYVNSHINGAPLLQIEKESTRPKVVQPEGLQVLDELIFSDEAYEDRSKISALAKNVRTYYGTLHKSIFNRPQANLYNIAAMRLELVRLFAMGVTGFDTPGLLNALDEAAAALNGMEVFFNESNEAQAANGEKISKLFKNAIAYLNRESSFNDFDRLTFFKDYIDPLYKELGLVQGDVNPEFLKYSSGWNPESKSIFAEDFLNPYYYTSLKKEEDSEALRDLGKSLFYDPVLSSDGAISCASCHQPEKAFTDGVPKSLSSVQGKTVLRNAPTLLNAVYADRYFYDLRAFTLEQQAEHVIFNTDEFNTAYSSILDKLAASPEYSKKFKVLFGKNGITRESFSKALASYVLSLKSFNSPFDKYIRGEVKDIPQDVKNGFNLFMGKANCATCHFVPTFSGLVPPMYNENESEILGVLQNPKAKSAQKDTDEGRLNNQVFSEYAWIYEKSFKTTTVRNAGLTAPYFHNGAYETLEEVIDFYNNGGGEGLGLPVTNQTLPPDPLDLTEKEKQDLIAFIKSLTDISVIN